MEFIQEIHFNFLNYLEQFLTLRIINIEIYLLSQ